MTKAALQKHCEDLEKLIPSVRVQEVALKLIANYPVDDDPLASARVMRGIAKGAIMETMVPPAQQ